MSVAAKSRHAKFAVATALLAFGGTAVAQNRPDLSPAAVRTSLALLEADENPNTRTREGMKAYLEGKGQQRVFLMLEVFHELTQPVADYVTQHGNDYRNKMPGFYYAPDNPEVRKIFWSYRNDPQRAAAAFVILNNASGSMMDNASFKLVNRSRNWQDSAVGLAMVFDDIRGGADFFLQAAEDLRKKEFKDGIQRDVIIKWHRESAARNGRSATTLRALLPNILGTASSANTPPSRPGAGF